MKRGLRQVSADVKMTPKTIHSAQSKRSQTIYREGIKVTRQFISGGLTKSLLCSVYNGS